MKKHLSVLILAADRTIYKIVALFILTAVIQAGIFILNMRSDPGGSLEGLLRESPMPLIGGICFLLLCALLGLGGFNIGGGRSGYTMRRLGVGERAVTAWYALYNSFCFLFFWVSQLAAALLICHIYTQGSQSAAQAGEAAGVLGGQEVFLAFYRQKYLHSLLPLDEAFRYIRNIICITGLGISSASMQTRAWHGQKSLSFPIMAALIAAAFSQDTGQLFGDIAISIAVFWLTLSSVYGVRRGALYEN